MLGLVENITQGLAVNSLPNEAAKEFSRDTIFTAS